MEKADCMYCTKNEKLQKLMIPIAEYEGANIYYFKDQKHRGRCIVAADGHYDELYQMKEEKRNKFMSVVSKLALIIQEEFDADKINYAVYGDLVPHFHVHLVPKMAGKLQWGGPFTDDIDKVSLAAEEYEQDIEKIKRRL